VYEGKAAVQLVVHDITEAKQKRVQLEHVASHDALTGLPNRILMRDRLNNALAYARRYGRQTTVVFLDLDNFKIINDSLGHDQGDVLLKTVAERLSGCMRELDTVARLGGDEFVVVLFEQPGANDTIVPVLARIRNAVTEPVVLAGREYSVTPSIGYATYPRDGLDADTLLRNADEAMYQAKELGRNRFQSYSDELHAQITGRLALQSDLRLAIERGELFVHYQPQTDARSGKLLAVEALARWHHPEQGMIAPEVFVPVAEESGLITTMGELVLRKACAQCSVWQAAELAPLRVSVNLSARQFWQPDLVRVVERALQESGLDAQHLELELTESLIMKSIEEAAKTMRTLREMGVGLAIDDFGTGYSSLASLKQFPIVRLKIAPVFLRGIPSDPDGVAIVRAIITLGHSMNLKVIADGVETEEQLQFLRAAGCDEVQGYLISKPVSHEKIAELLKRSLAELRASH
jgi:diguanylate cyclase (GGDEF)-like protein